MLYITNYQDALYYLNLSLFFLIYLLSLLIFDLLFGRILAQIMYFLLNENIEYHQKLTHSGQKLSKIPELIIIHSS